MLTNNMKKLFFIFVLYLTLFLPQPLKAQTVAFSFQIHVYFTDSAITLNPAFKTPYNLLSIPYVQPDGNSYGEIYSISGMKLANFTFMLNPGANDIAAPYFPNAGKIVLYGPTTGIPNFSINVSGSAICNENSICEQSAGESANNCPKDCETLTTNQTNQTTVPQNNSTTSARSGQNNVLWLSLVILFFLLTASLGIYLYIKRKTANAS